MAEENFQGVRQIRGAPIVIHGWPCFLLSVGVGTWSCNVATSNPALLTETETLLDNHPCLTLMSETKPSRRPLPKIFNLLLRKGKEHLNGITSLSLSRCGRVLWWHWVRFQRRAWLVLDVIIPAGATSGVQCSQRAGFYLGRQGDKCVIALGPKEKGFSVFKSREAFTLFTSKASKWIFVGHLIFNPISTGYEAQRCWLY